MKISPKVAAMAGNLFLAFATLVVTAHSTPNVPVKFLETGRGPAQAAPKLVPPTSSQSLDTNDATDLESMEKAMTELLLGNSTFGATPMGGSVKKIRDILTKTMMPKVLAAHRSDQRLINRLAAAVKKCGHTKNSAFRGARSQFMKYKGSSRLHKRCRADEAVRYTSKRNCLKSQKNLYRIKVLRCKAFASVSKRYGTTKNNQAIVNKAGGESVESYIVRLSGTICGRHVHGRKGTRSRKGGWGGGLAKGMLDKYLRSKERCRRATRAYTSKVKECRRKTHSYNVRKAQCNQYQSGMDKSACKRAIVIKDACESYAGCYHARAKAYRVARGKVAFQERDRKAEWRGLKRMTCLMRAFADGKVTNGEVNTCKRQDWRPDAKRRLTIRYPKIPPLVKCATPTLYPATGAYKRAEFVPLPLLAKGKRCAPCSGMTEIKTKPWAGSPRHCKCTRVSLNGPYSPGPLVKCTNCKRVRRSRERSSCPSGTKIFAPRSRSDWQTFFRSARPLYHPHWIIDITRPQNGCGGCTSNPMNSGNRRQKSWRTSDGAPWWLRNTRYSEPNGNYHANCYLNLWRNPRNADRVTFDDASCAYNSRSYYCQPTRMNLNPGRGSPASCKCSKVNLAGRYSAGTLVKCEQCTTVYRSTQRNSCPAGMKIFSPRSARDWKTFLNSAGPLRAPHWIIDVTRPQNGCGGCTRYPMKSTTPQQATWRTRDRSVWWLRNSRYSEPNGDYRANCFMDLWRRPASAYRITFNDHHCNYRSRSYYCQPVQAKRRVRPHRKPRKVHRRRLVPWSLLVRGFKEEAFYFRHGLRRVPRLRTANSRRLVSAVNYRSTGGTWRGWGQRDRFAGRWSGYLIINRAGSYRFKITSDDGSRLYVNNHFIINNDGLHGMRTRDSGNRRMVAGQHSLRLEMFENGGGAGMILRYRGKDTRNRWNVVSNVRARKENGWKEEVYSKRGMRRVPRFNPSKAKMVRTIPRVAYGNTGRNWPGFRMRDNFAVRWTGRLQVSRLGNYRFSLRSDDGSKMFFGRRLIVNNDGLHGLRNRESNYRMRGTYSLELQFFERGGHAGMLFRYMGPDTRNRMIYVPKGRMTAAI